MQVDRTATLLAEELSVSASQSGDPEDKVFRFDSAKLSMVSVAQCRAAQKQGRLLGISYCNTGSGSLVVRRS